MTEVADIYQDVSLNKYGFHPFIREHPKFDATLFLVFALFLSVLGSIISK